MAKEAPTFTYGPNGQKIWDSGPRPSEDHFLDENSGEWILSSSRVMEKNMANSAAIFRKSQGLDKPSRWKCQCKQCNPEPPGPDTIFTAPLADVLVITPLWCPWWTMSKKVVCLCPLDRLPQLKDALHPADCFQWEGVAMVYLGECRMGPEGSGKLVYPNSKLRENTGTLYLPLDSYKADPALTKQLRAKQLADQLRKDGAGALSLQVQQIERQVKELSST